MWIVQLLVSLVLALLLFLSSRDAILLALYGKYTHGTVAANPTDKQPIGELRFSGLRYDGHFALISLPYPAPIGFGFDVVYLPNEPRIVAFAKKGDSPLLLITRSVGFLHTLLLSAGMTYFFFRGLTGAREYFSASTQAGTAAGQAPSPKAAPVYADVWNGDLSQIPGHDAQKPQPTIQYPGVVPISLQPGEGPEPDQFAHRKPAAPFADSRHILLQPEEPQARDKSEDGTRS